MAKKRCKFCRCLFPLTKRNPDQKYCSKPDCQRARKRRWQKMKMQGDEAYRLNQKAPRSGGVRRILTTGGITGKTTRTTPEVTGKDSSIETGAGGPLVSFPGSLQRWTRYQSKIMTYQVFTA